VKFSIVVLLVLLAFAALFTVQNPEVVTVRFLGFSGNTLLLVVIVASFAAGVVWAALATVPSYFRRRSEAKEAKQRTRELEAEVARLRKEVELLRPKAAAPPGSPKPGGAD
jgi:uncharacterized integral membrane protein